MVNMSNQLLLWHANSYLLSTIFSQKNALNLFCIKFIKLEHVLVNNFQRYLL